MENERGLEAIIRIQDLASQWDVMVVTPTDSGLALTMVRNRYDSAEVAIDFIDDIGDFPMKERLSKLKTDKILYVTLPEMRVEGQWDDNKFTFNAAPTLFGLRRIAAYNVLGRTVEDAAWAGAMGEAVCLAGEASVTYGFNVYAEVTGDLGAEDFEEWFDRLDASDDAEARSFGKEIREFFANASAKPETDDDEDGEEYDGEDAPGV